MGKILQKIKTMPLDEFYHLCNRLVKEMGFSIRNGVYREDTVVFDAYLPVPGGEIRYIIIFLRKDRFTGFDLEELVDFETLQIRWMIATTGEIDNSAKEKIPNNMEITLLDGSDLERLIQEFGIIKDENHPGSFLPSAGKLDEALNWARDFLKAGNYEKALEYVNNALRIKVTPHGLKLKARILNEMGKYDEAVLLMQRVLEENVRDDEAWFIFATILENMGRYQDAEEAYGQCVRFNPRNLGCWLNRGNILFEMEKYDESLLCYENALKIRQDLPQVWNNRGVVLKHLGKYDDAMRSYNAALKYDPDFAQAYLNKALLFFEMRRYEEAENAVYEYLKREESEEGYLLLANIYLKRQLLGKAEEMAKKALELNPGSIEAKKILRKVRGGKVKDIEDEIKREISDILNMLPDEEMDTAKSILREARELAGRGDFEGARSKLEEAREYLKRYVNEEMMRKAIIEDILEISDGNVPDNLEDMDINELRSLRERIIMNIKRRGEEEKTKEHLLKAIDRIKEDMERSDILTPALELKIEEAKSKIISGEFSEAVEVLLEISASVEREKIDEMRKLLIEDTQELLRDAGMEIPDLENMDLAEIKALRSKAIERLKGSDNDSGLKGMVAALTGGAMGIKEEIKNDIVELSKVANVEIPDDFDEMSLAELKDLRSKIIEKIKNTTKTRKEIEKYPRGFGQILLELGRYEDLMDMDIEEDEFIANARGIYLFESGRYEEAIDQFKRALAINPEFVEAEFNLGYALIKIGKEEEGLLHIKKAGFEELLKRKI